MLADSGAVTAPYKVTTSKGTHDGKLSSQWFSRPDDQRFLSLNDLYSATKAAADRSMYEIIDTRDIRVIAERDDPEDLRLRFPTQRGDDVTAKPTNWSFGQICSLAKAPAGYLSKLPGSIAGINLQYGLNSVRSEAVKAYCWENGDSELRAATGPEYGRIYDHEVVSAVQQIAGDGTGSTRWKIPGVINWSTMEYDPNSPITKQSTTLFASDRDIFLFLCDDRHPIEVGKLDNGDPDYMFRGFYVWNSEVGARSLGIATMYLRACCQNRCLWGVEGYSEIKLRHSKGAPGRFAAEVMPALESYADNNTGAVLAGVAEAKRLKLASSDDSRAKVLKDRGFSQSQAKAVIDACFEQDGRPPESVWDFVQGITAAARDIGRQDERLAMERVAGRMLDKVKV